MSKKLAEEFSMDIPHVTAIELPLIVNDVGKAVNMLGGQEKLKKAAGPTSFVENKKPQLELRLRNDRFHHPIQSISNEREKLLIKVTVPKKNLPPNYKSLSLREIIEINENNNGSTNIQPISIINKTFSFKSINDFQINTKNNQMVNEINDKLINNYSFKTFKELFGEDKFLNNQDYKNPENYFNGDHQLPPPAVFTSIKQVQDYQYAKNQSTETIKTETGELKVISKKALPKLYSKVLDVNNSATPMEPHPELVKSFNELMNSQLVPNSFNYDLLGCIKWLKEIFEIKPIWLRKHLEDIVSNEHKRVLKQALPYVTYIYKNGPWRFCNIKLGVDPKTSQQYWIFQSEYFRVSSYNFRHKSSDSSERVLPQSVKSFNEFSKLSNASINKVKIDGRLIFKGDVLPSTITYQIGDVIDEDVESIIETSRKKGEFFRDLDLKNDGWINRQTIETIRRVIKYKLQQLIKEEPVDRTKITKLINTNYKDVEDELDEEDDNEDNEQDPEVDIEVDEEIDEESSETESPIPESADEIISKIKRMDSSMGDRLSKLTEFIKQESIM
ncbi:transcription factor tau 95 kDa subunit [[Candida] jaroonii]|uniref:Transcription factor tau 95 kDa subunit n=1 Tax=[Candida] jaroonii TaxID=467808 RepID=A0ACA9YAD3_9ASCO|nr:transcription factor tau 95 kDa subunit [[Candida] jaroonii]